MKKTTLFITVSRPWRVSLGLILLTSLILVGAECGGKERDRDKEKVEKADFSIKAIVFNDQNKNGVLDEGEERMPNIHLDESRDDEYFGGVLSDEKGEAVWSDLPLDTKITISIPVRGGVYLGWRTVVYWPVTTEDKYDFFFEEEPIEPEIIYFGLSKED